MRSALVVAIVAASACACSLVIDPDKLVEGNGSANEDASVAADGDAESDAMAGGDGADSATE